VRSREHRLEPPPMIMGFTRNRAAMESCRLLNCRTLVPPGTFRCGFRLQCRHIVNLRMYFRLGVSNYLLLALPNNSNHINYTIYKMKLDSMTSRTLLISLQIQIQIYLRFLPIKSYFYKVFKPFE
jgi:hypothetical protein